MTNLTIYKLGVLGACLCILSAAYVAAHGNSGWGWFLLVGYLIYPTVSEDKK
mgnify:CR=1 FL=1